MDLEQYKNTYADLSKYGSAEAHVNYESPEYLANDTERRIKLWAGKRYPGVAYQRTGNQFTVDLFAYNNTDHLDYLSRALFEAYPQSFVNTIHASLPDWEAAYDQAFSAFRH